MFYRALTEEQTLRVRRARPVIALAAVAFAIGAILGAGHGRSAADALADKFVGEWAQLDYTAMYANVDAASRRSVTADEFVSAFHQAKDTATATSLRVTGKARAAQDGLVAVPVTVRTRLFGTLRLNVEMRIVRGLEGGHALP